MASRIKYAVGYSIPPNGESFTEIVSDYRESIAEVYFSWPGIASGRPRDDASRGYVNWDAQEILKEDLKQIRSWKISLDLLWNANCYGAYSASEKLRAECCSVLEHLAASDLMPEVFTTASPFLAEMVKREFPGLDIRASVNMRIDSTLAMEYLADIFDSFYIRRDLQRDIETVKLFSGWCRSHGKKLCMLANSGCLRNCPSQTYHDNLVAHDSEISEIRNVPDFIPHLCWSIFRKPEHYEEFLRMNWVRPEDIAGYAPYFDVIKLATRAHSNPRSVIGAYSREKFDGNLLELTEPGFSRAFAPFIIDNSKFPKNWIQSAGRCAATCTHCGKCTEILKKVLINTKEKTNEQNLS